MWEGVKDFFSGSPASGGIRVLVVGDLMLDTYIRGTVDRISPEAPVQVLEWSGKEDNAPGGAANVACNLVSLGCVVRLLGVVGRDPRGDELKSILQGKGVDTGGLITCEGRPTTHKTRVIAHNQQVIRIDREDSSPLPEGAIAELSRHLERTMPLVDGVICSDYAKGLLEPALMGKLLREAELYEKPVVVDPKGENYDKYSGCHSITINVNELSRTTGMSIEREADVEKAARKLMATVRCQSVLVTRAEQGVSLVMPDGETEHIAARAKEVYDVTGAGDTVVSVFSMALFGGLSPVEAAAAANAAGGIVVGKLGTSVVTRGEILHHFQNQAAGVAGSKVVKLEHLKEELQRERGLGKKLVFTNGCFDPIHKGHIGLLEQAAELGDVLVVGLNSDSSVRRLKGENRPSWPEEDRAYILGALASVDYVTIFDEDTPEVLIREIRPHVLVKGEDYRLEEVVGREFVESYGGKVELIPLVPDRSSTKYILDIVEKNRRK